MSIPVLDSSIRKCTKDFHEIAFETHEDREQPEDDDYMHLTHPGEQKSRARRKGDCFHNCVTKDNLLHRSSSGMLSSCCFPSSLGLCMELVLFYDFSHLLCEYCFIMLNLLTLYQLSESPLNIPEGLFSSFPFRIRLFMIWWLVMLHFVDIKYQLIFQLFTIFFYV